MTGCRARAHAHQPSDSSPLMLSKAMDPSETSSAASLPAVAPARAPLRRSKAASGSSSSLAAAAVAAGARALPPRELAPSAGVGAALRSRGGAGRREEGRWRHSVRVSPPFGEALARGWAAGRQRFRQAGWAWRALTVPRPPPPPACAPETETRRRWRCRPPAAPQTARTAPAAWHQPSSRAEARRGAGRELRRPRRAKRRSRRAQRPTRPLGCSRAAR